MRSVVDMAALGERTVVLELRHSSPMRHAYCSITGALVALAGAAPVRQFGRLKNHADPRFLVATSVGLVDGVPMLDLSTTRIPARAWT